MAFESPNGTRRDGIPNAVDCVILVKLVGVEVGDEVVPEAGDVVLVHLILRNCQDHTR